MAYEFDGVNDWIGNTITCPVSSGPCSAACWFWPNAANRHMINLSSTSGETNFRFSVDTSNFLQFNALVSGSGITVNTSGTVSRNGWNFGGFRVVSATERKIYLSSYPNYILETASSTTSRNPTGLTRLHIGSRRNNSATDNYFDGKIAEVAIWNTALADSDFTSLSEGVACNFIKPQNLVFYAPLIREIVDLSVAKLALTNNGGATVASHPRIYR